MVALTDKTINAARSEGKTKIAAGGSLYLYFRGGSALWIHHYREGASQRTRSLGSYPEMTPTKAIRARETFSAIRRGARIERKGLAIINSAAPAAEPRQAVKITATRERFAVVLEEYLARYMPEWKTSSRDREAFNYRKLAKTELGAMWIDEITTENVERALKKGWGHALPSLEKHRMRLSKIFGFATAKGYIPENQPNAARKDVFEHLIAKAPEVKHHKPMPSADVPAFMAELVADQSPEARALALLILTGVRTNEARDVDWSEFDGNVWTVPGGLEGRMKEKKVHRIWLTPAAMALLGKPKKSGRVFGELPHDALIEKLKAMRPGKGYTVHGFRTTLKGDWGLRAGYPLELREMAIGHAISDQKTAGYNLPAEELYTIVVPMLTAWSDFAMSKAVG